MGGPSHNYSPKREYASSIVCEIVAWEMKLKMEQLEPELGRLIAATPPGVEDMLKR